MDATPDIISTLLIPAACDDYWETISETAAMTPKSILVLTAPLVENSAEQKQVQNIINACKLNADEYNILYLSEGWQIAWHKIRDTLGIKIVLLIGILPAQLGVTVLLKLNEYNHYNGCLWIPALSATEMEKKPEMKAQLWNNALKPVFADKSVAV
ncbi:MAG: hypothetical protein H0X33_09300 [Taibaiella sp.]|nr:hypothetical protein [Taibaiella sp.]